MNINQLEYFVCVAKHLSFTKAAAECCVVQSAISQQITALEAELGFQLFDRSKRRISLTPAGERYYQDTLVLLEQLKRNTESAKSIATGVSGSLKIGIAGYNQVVYMDSLKAFHMNHPSVELNFIPVSTLRQYAPLVAGEYDMIFTATFNLSEHEDISFAGEVESSLAIFMHEDHPLAALESIDLELAAVYPNIIAEFEEDMPADVTNINNIYTANGLTPTKIIYAKDQNLNSFLLAFNMGIGIAPEELINSMPSHVVRRELENGRYKMRMGWGYHSGNTNPALKSFIESIR